VQPVNQLRTISNFLIASSNNNLLKGTKLQGTTSSVGCQL
jgi:hypothetical protein